MLRDQAQRATRREEATPRRPGPNRWAPAAAGVLALLLAWVLVAPPAFLVPPPPAPPRPTLIEAGLRMDLYMAAAALENYREANGRYPDALIDALEEPGDAADITYEAMSGSYRLIGQRDTFVVVHDGREGLQSLVSLARPVVEGR